MRHVRSGVEGSGWGSQKCCGSSQVTVGPSRGGRSLPDQKARAWAHCFPAVGWEGSVCTSRVRPAANRRWCRVFIEFYILSSDHFTGWECEAGLALLYWDLSLLPLLFYRVLFRAQPKHHLLVKAFLTPLSRDPLALLCHQGSCCILFGGP